MFTVSGAAPAAPVPLISARVASHAYWSLAPQAKSRTSEAVKCQVAGPSPVVKTRPAEGPGVSTRTTRPERRAAARLSRPVDERIAAAFWSVPVAPTTQPRGTVRRTS